MAVFRIERTRDYTVMSNHHLRNEKLSLKAKGLLSMMLSLPDDWNYTTRGLAKICKEGVDAIGGARVELTSKEASYIERTVGDYPDSPLSEGLCRLNGAQALAFARCRALDNDMGRGQRQSRLMAAMVAQTRRMTALNVVNVFAALKHAWSSSLSGFAQVRLLGSALWLRGAKVTSIVVPFEGHWHYGEVKGNNGVVINMDQNVRLLREALGLKPLVLPAQ